MAARDFIKIVKNDSVTAQKALDLLTFKDAVARVLMLGPPLLAAMNHNFDDSNPQAIVWTDFALFGIPSGKEQTVFDMVNGVMGAMTGTMQNAQAVEISARVG